MNRRVESKRRTKSKQPELNRSLGSFATLVQKYGWEEVAEIAKSVAGGPGRVLVFWGPWDEEKFIASVEEAFLQPAENADDRKLIIPTVVARRLLDIAKRASHPKKMPRLLRDGYLAAARREIDALRAKAKANDKRPMQRELDAIAKDYAQGLNWTQEYFWDQMERRKSRYRSKKKPGAETGPS